MPRTNIPYRSMRPYTTRKRSNFTRTHFKNNPDSQSSESQQGHVNNILVFPKYSETTINVVGDNSRIYPYGNLLKKIKGRKRKDKQRMKKKQTVEGDVKPIVKKLTPAKMNPRLNQHIIFLSDSEGDDTDEDTPENTLIVNEIPVKDTGVEDDDDVIFVETPAPEIIEIEDTLEQNESPQKLPENTERSSSPDDFLDNAHINLKSKFDLEPEGIAFAKPTTAPVDMSESGSISSVSDISATVGMNVFKLIDFPQEKVSLFDDDNLEKFRDAITPKRTNKKQADDQNDKLPTLSDIQAETPNRHERGRSIIKELVNDRAYVLLSQKKSKNKKRKSKDETDTENAENSSESKKKKKKKTKKKESNEMEDDTITNEGTDSCPEVSFNSKKVKKNKHKDHEVEDEDNSENKKKKCKKTEESSKIVPDTPEENTEKKKKKHRKNSEETGELSIQENTEERKKKKIKKNLEESQLEENEERKAKKSKENQMELQQTVPEENDERRRKKSKENQVEPQKTVPEESRTKKTKENQLEPQQTTTEENEERRRKKSKENQVEPQKTVPEESRTKKTKENQLEPQQTVPEENEERKRKRIKDNQLEPLQTILEESEERKRKKIKENQLELQQTVSEENEDRRRKKTRKNVDEKEAEQENIEERKKKRNRRSSAPSDLENMEEKENGDTEIQNEEKRKKKTKIVETEIQEVTTQNEEEIELKLETTEEEKQEETPKEHTIVESMEIEEIQEIRLNESTKDTGEDNRQVTDKEESINKEKTCGIVVIETEENRSTNEEICEEVVTEIKTEEPKQIEHIVDNIENRPDDTTESLRKRKQDLDESLNNSIDNKRMKLYEENLVETPIVESDTNAIVISDGIKVEENKDEDTETINIETTSVCKDSQVNLTVPSDISQNPMMVIDNEGNVDMKLTSVTSIFPNETNFSKDVIVDNFVDKNTSWNADPTRFCSYNASLFNDTNKEDSVIAVEDSRIESTNSESEPKNNEIIEVKQEKDISEIVSIEDETNRLEPIVVKVEEKSEELPNDIEEIVKEKENLNTVKKLCEFLEEVNDPNDVLKKVSLLKKAFTGKSPDTGRPIATVQITEDNDDIVSVSSCGSSVICCEEDVSVVCIDDDITLANCDITETTTKITERFETIDEDLNKTDDVVLVETSPKRCDAVEVIREAFKRGDKFQLAQSTPKKRTESGGRFVTRSGGDTGAVSRTRGLDKFEVNEVQDLMSDNPRLWRIVPADIHPIKLPNKGKRCIKCREIGHLGYNCPNRLKLPKCSLCGNEGHLDFKCPNKLCIQCGRKAPMVQNCCDHCKHFRNLTCAMCKNKGHPKNKCPDMWRRYHLTVNHGPLVHGEVLKLKNKERLWCSSCARSGHIDTECEATWRKFRYSQPLDPRIHFYEDVYKIAPDPSNDQEFVQPNLDEVPQTSSNFLRDTSSPSSSSSSEKNENDTLETVDQTGQSVGEGLQGLPPDFEVIDEVTDERQETAPETTEMAQLFMTAPADSIRQFLRQELSVLETGKFEIKNIHPRFFAFVEDDKYPEHKQRFSRKKKEAFYKSLNMLLFGKLQVKAGQIHTDKLKNFVNLSTSVLDRGTRESLYYSYDYLFKNSPHNYMNYKFFLKMIRNKYGNKKWIF